MKRSISKGIYLILDPSMNRSIQIWDNFPSADDPVPLVKEILELCHPTNIPVLVNNRWDLLMEADLDGIHLDEIPEDLGAMRQKVGRNIIVGITCSNDPSIPRWAEKNELDYLSFCSMFPSSTASSCELVSHDTVKSVRKTSSLPIFLAGGIRPENLELLDRLDYSGIAVVSGIMSVEDPRQAIKNYQGHKQNSI
jgi:thiamine-phosphate pyrophosphorylase